MLLSGADRQLVCNALVVTDRALRKWIRLFNQSGVDGLIVNKRPGRTAIIQGSQAIEFSSIMEHPEFADRTFWTAKAFHGCISNAYQVECSHETIVRFLHREGFALSIQDPGAVGIKKETKPAKNGDHLRMNVMGMICPRTGKFFAIETSHSDTETFQAFLVVINNPKRNQKTASIGTLF